MSEFKAGDIVEIIRVEARLDEDSYNKGDRLILKSKGIWKVWNALLRGQKQMIHEDEFKLIKEKTMRLEDIVPFKIHAGNEETNRKVQEKLFEMGCIWLNDSKEIATDRNPYLFINDKERIDWGGSIEYFTEHAYTEFTLTDFFNLEVTPSIEIDVKINGKAAKLSDISEETLLTLHKI